MQVSFLKSKRNMVQGTANLTWYFSAALSKLKAQSAHLSFHWNVAKQTWRAFRFSNKLGNFETAFQNVIPSWIGCKGGREGWKRDEKNGAVVNLFFSFPHIGYLPVWSVRKPAPFQVVGLPQTGRARKYLRRDRETMSTRRMSFMRCDLVMWLIWFSAAGCHKTSKQCHLLSKHGGRHRLSSLHHRGISKFSSMLPVYICMDRTDSSAYNGCTILVDLQPSVTSVWLDLSVSCLFG